MKTVSEFYEEIRWNKELWESFRQAAEADRADAFMKEHGCDAPFEELTKYLQSLKKPAADIEQLTLEELEEVTGGFPTLEECIASWFLSDVYIPWMESWCPKCEFYFSNKN